MLELNPHTVDILGNTRGRDQLVMKMDRAVDFINHLDQEVFAASNTVFLDPVSKAGEVLFASALLSASHSDQANSSTQIAAHLYTQSRFFAIAPNIRHHKLSLLTFIGREEHANRFILNGDYLCENSGKIDKDAFRKNMLQMLQHIESLGNKKIVIVSNLPCQRKDNTSAKFIYNALVDMLLNDMIDQMLVTVPERWFSGAKKLSQFREIKSGRIKYIRVKNSRWVFPSFGNREGVCFVYGDADYSGNSIIIDSGNQRTEAPLPTTGMLSNLFTNIMNLLLKK